MVRILVAFHDLESKRGPRKDRLRRENASVNQTWWKTGYKHSKFGTPVPELFWWRRMDLPLLPRPLLILPLAMRIVLKLTVSLSPCQGFIQS